MAKRSPGNDQIPVQRTHIYPQAPHSRNFFCLTPIHNVFQMNGMFKNSRGLCDLTKPLYIANYCGIFEGRRVYPFSTPLCVPGETLGLVRAAASSSSLSFLKVLLGIQYFDVLGAWWTSPEGAAVAGHLCFVDLPVSAFISLFFPYFFFWARLCCGPSKLVVSCGYYIIIAGHKPVWWIVVGS
jgi:hypothetical protein